MNPDDFELDVDAMEFDKNGIDFQERYEETEKQQAYQQQQELQLENEATQAKAELDDPREREGGGGLRGVVKEIQSAIAVDFKILLRLLSLSQKEPLICSVVKCKKNSKLMKATELNGMTGL